MDTKELRKEILDMSSLVEESLSIVAQNQFETKNVYELEDKINKYHTKIDDLCFKYLALMRPVAKDLRTTLAIMKINSELERIGDEVINIKIYHDFSHNTSIPQLDTMTEETRKMVKNAMDSLVSKSVKLAMNVIENDQVVNELNRSVIQTFFEGVKEQNFSANDGFNVVLVAKSLERIGDHATNIAEDVIFLVSGDDIRHPDSSSQRDHALKDDNTNKSNNEGIVSFLKPKKSMED